MPTINPAILQPGDSILYRPSNLIGVIIAIKTWGWISHIEGYTGNGQSVGARASGVNLWPLRNDKYVRYVLRPKVPFDLAKAMDWFNREAKGDKYSVGGLFGFYDPDLRPGPRNPKAEFCSQLVDMWYDAGGFLPFNPRYPANKISPVQFLQSPVFTQVFP